MEAIILAAGKGTRLWPITKVIPKPLIPIRGKPVIAWIVDRLKIAGFRRIYVNLHYLGEMIRKYLDETFPDVEFVYSVEEELLGTGGGLRRLFEMTEGDVVLVHNADAFEEFDLEAVLKHFAAADFPVMWVLKNGPGNVVVKGDRVVEIGGKGKLFTGVSVWRRELLKFIPSGKCDLIPVVRKLLKLGRLEIGAHFEENFFQDIGTAQGIFDAYRFLLKRVGKSIEIEEGAVVETECLKGLVYVGEKARVEKGAILENAVILGRTYVKSGEEVRYEIVFDGLSKKVEPCAS